MQAALRVVIASASRPYPGETECGDQALVLVEGTHHLVALADGLGHGQAAAEAAKAAMSVVAAQRGAQLPELIAFCHSALVHTRGVALSVMRIDAGARRAVFAGVGNVDVVSCCRDRTRPVLSAGVVGGRLRRVIVTELPLSDGDLFVMHTDGISSRFEPETLRALDAGVAARRLLATHAKEQDDAACIVIRC